MTARGSDAEYDPPIHVGWSTPRGMALHLTALVAVAGCAAATWWQLDRALGGNGLSWAYTFEWPCFAVFSVVLWWKIIHDPADDPGQRVVRPAQRAGPHGPDAADAAEAAEALEAATRAEVERAVAQGDWHPA